MTDVSRDADASAVTTDAGRDSMPGVDENAERTCQFVGEGRGVTRRWVYRVEPPVPVEEWDNGAQAYVPAGFTDWLVVSWGREGDTAVFPADEKGRILDMMDVYAAEWWEPHESAMEHWRAGFRRESEVPS